MQADSHTRNDQVLILHIGSGTLEFPASAVSQIQTMPGDHAQSIPSHSSAPAATARDLLKAAAKAQGLPEELVQSVARAESGFRPDAVSRRGALGLMQLMPGTAASLGVNPQCAAENAEGGAKYLRSLLLRYHGDSALALAAYNAGPGAVARFGGVPPYEETRRYVTRVLNEYSRQRTPESKASAGERISRPSATN